MSDNNSKKWSWVADIVVGMTLILAFVWGSYVNSHIAQIERNQAAIMKGLGMEIEK